MIYSHSVIDAIRLQQPIFAKQISDQYGDQYEQREECDYERANLISSKMIKSNLHRPILDIDIPAHLVPSSTPGHSHLYLETAPMSWRKYRRLLRALAAAGVIEPGYYRASKRRRATHLRKPGVLKVQAAS